MDNSSYAYPIGFGMLLHVAAGAFAGFEGWVRAMGVAVACLGLLLLVVGCIRLARSKGRHPAWGILGLFSTLGLAALSLLSELPGTAKR